MAYNAIFDFGHLWELRKYKWYDIMKIASNKEYNIEITEEDDCFSSGRLKANYGVENMYRRLSNNRYYSEKHNALLDALDEFELFKMLGYNIEFYKNASIDIKSICYKDFSPQRGKALYSEKINMLTKNKVSVVDFNSTTFLAKYHCNKCENEWVTRTAIFYREQKCTCPRCRH